MAVAAVLAVGMTGGTANAGGGQDRDGLRQALSALADAGVAGVQLRLHDEQGDWTSAAGVRRLSGGKVPTNGRYRAGSITKMFVSTVVLQLVAEGAVVLDAPVADYLPEFGLDRRITVRMLLQHTSGLFNYTGEPLPDGTVEPGIPLAGEEFLANRFRAYSPAELVAVATAKPARFAPGTDYRYSNTNYVLAGLLVERVTGTPYATQVRQRVLAPLRLRETVLPGRRTDLPGPHAHGYFAFRADDGFRVVDVTRVNPSWAWAAGEVVSTTRDLDTFVRALFGGRLLPEALLAEMVAPSAHEPYGLGVELLDGGPECGGRYLGHTGGVPGYQSFTFTTPDLGTRLHLSITLGDADLTDPAVARRLQAAYNAVVVAALCDVPAAGRTLVPDAA